MSKHDAVTQRLVGDLVKYPGCHLRVPIPMSLHKTLSQKERDLMQTEVCVQTSILLTMMGIEHEMGADNTTLMVKDI